MNLNVCVRINYNSSKLIFVRLNKNSFKNKLNKIFFLVYNDFLL